MRRAMDAGTLLAAVAVAGLAIVCCAGLPSGAAMFAGLTVAVILGSGGVIIGVVAVGGAGALLLRARRHRACSPAD